MAKPTPEEKLKELMVYVASKCVNDHTFGLTKLAKIILFADMLHYANFGQPITGQTYTKEERGPLAKDFYKVKNQLVKNKEVVEVTVPVITHSRVQLVVTREPNYSLFSAQEISFVDTVIKAFEKANNTGVSEFSHNFFVGWQDMKYGEEIPYETVFLPPNYELTDADKSYSAQLIKQYGWDKTYGWASG